MIKVETVRMMLSENAVTVELTTGKKYMILLKDYDNLPFECKMGSPLENIMIDTEKNGASETNEFFDGNCLIFLNFLARKYSIYNSAMSKLSVTDMSKKHLYQKLYYSALKNQKKKNAPDYPDAPVMQPEELRAICRLVCNEFEQSGYINDMRYALDKAKYLKEYKKYGINKIKEYLYQRGVKKEEINKVLSDEIFYDEDGDFENMQTLLNRKIRTAIDPADRNAVSKAVKLLERYGYPYVNAKKAVIEFIKKNNSKIH